jgi:hypothetical protein
VNELSRNAEATWRNAVCRNTEHLTLNSIPEDDNPAASNSTSISTTSTDRRLKQYRRQARRSNIPKTAKNRYALRITPTIEMLRFRPKTTSRRNA